MNKLNDFSELAGRVLLATIFVLTGAQKITGYEGTAGYMAAMGVPAALLPAVIATELGGGLLIAIGLFTRLAAFALAGFTLIAAVIFHSNFGDQMQSIMFMKNLAIAGAFLILVARGAGRFSLDARHNG